MSVRSYCTRSLGASHPVCPGLAGLQGFTAGIVTDGGSHGAAALPATAITASGVAAPPPDTFLHGARPGHMVPRGKGAAAGRMKLPACGKAAGPQTLERI